MSDNQFQTYTRQIIFEQEAVLKTIFIKIFIEIYNNLKKSCSLAKKDEEYLDELIYFTDDMDLTSATGLFRVRFFKHPKLSKVKDISFSIENINGIINTTRFQERMAKQNIISSIEINKPYSLNLLAMEELGRIADEITRIRHMAAHSGNLNQSSQALILMSNIARLLNITPDSIKDTTSGFTELEKFIKYNYFDSIVDVFRPDIEENKSIEKSQDEDIKEALLIEKIDSMSVQLNELNEIKLALASQDKNVITEIKDFMKSYKDEIIDEFKIRKEDFSVHTKQESPNESVNLSDQVKINLGNNRTKFKDGDEAIEWFAAAKEHDDAIEEKIKDEQASKKPILPEHKKKNIKVEDLEIEYSSYLEALDDNIDKRKVVAWVINDITSGYGLTDNELSFVKDLVDEGLIDSYMYEDYLQTLSKEGSLSKSELYDELMSLRLQIKNYMSSKNSSFQNWHNILMTTLAHQIIDNRIDSENLLREDFIFIQYYNSQKGRYDRDSDEIAQTKEFFEIQIEKYWSTIEKLVERLS